MIGTIIGDTFRVVESLGTGGMAHVYKVVHVRARHMYALKILKAEFADDAEFLRRFEREAQACLALHHENIVRAYGMGQFEGLPYIVMEYVEGETLKDRVVRAGALPPHKAIAVGCQLLDALEAAHKHGIVHRDIKPQNIILTKRGKVKLTDFGIARELNGESTRTYAGNNVIGSAHYMPPEQARGEPVETAGDIYSLGVTLYETLTGRVPFTGDTAVAIALQHLQAKPLPPQELDAEIAPALSDVILRALAKNPENRYASCTDMRLDLVRSMTDPFGDFVFNTPDSEAPSRKRNTGYYWLFAGLLLPILALILYFFLYRSACADPNLPLQSVASPEATLQPETPEPTVAPQTRAIPNVEGQTLAEALHMLYDAGFTNLYSRAQIDENTEKSGTIRMQTPDASIQADLETPIFLTVVRAAPGKYYADISFTVDIPRNACNVHIVYETATEDGIPYRVLVLDEEWDREENVVIVARARSNDPATRTMILLIDDEWIAAKDVKFSE